MAHPAAGAIPILDAAAALGLKIDGRRTNCFNAVGHQGGNDARPSLTFYPDSNRFMCFSCGAKGDVIDLVKAVNQCDFKAAVQWVMGLAGKSSSPDRQRVRSNATSQARTPDEQARKVYVEMYKNTYEVGPKMPAGKFLQKRGIDLALARSHQANEMGNPEELWMELLSKFGEDRLRSAGLVSRSGKFLFARHRLLFFYFDDGWPVFVQARNTDGLAVAKEFSPVGLHSPVPYNADLLRVPQQRIVLCEGCIDTLSALQMGLPAVGVPGTQGFRKEWFELFRNVEHVAIHFDNDEAGKQQAAELRAQFRIRGIKADAYHPQGGKDMNDLLLQKLKGASK